MAQAPELSAEGDAEGTTSASPRRWIVAALLGLGVLVNYFDRVNLSVSHDALLKSFGISTVTFGYLLSAYSWTYAAMQIPSGILLDRFGVRRVYIASVLLWGAASAGAALATSLPLFFIARLFLGIGEAPTFPANAKAVGEWFAPEDRSLPTAIFDSAAKLSIGIGVPVLGLLLVRFGWRWSFLATAAVSFAFAGLFALLYRERTQSGTRAHVPTGNDIVPVTVTYLLRQRKVVGVTLGSAAYNYSFYLLLTWLPFYMASAFHVDAVHSVVYASIPWLFAAATDFVIGGWLVEHLIRRGSDADRVRRWVLVGGTALGMGLAGAAFTRDPHVAVFWLSVSLGGLAAAAPVVWSVPSLIAPQGGVGRVGAIMNFGNQLAAIVAPIATGYLLSALHSFRAAFVAASAFLLVGITGYVFLLGRITRVPAPEAALLPTVS